MSKIKEIPGYEGRYAVDDKGNVYSLRGKVPRKMKPQVSTGGYLKIMLYRDGVGKWAYIHRIVAEAFLMKPEGCDVVNHIDTDPQNCAVSNLEWTSQAGNIEYSRKLGNQNKDKPVSIIAPSGEVLQYGNMREASRELFGSPLVLRGQYRRKGQSFKYHGFGIEVMPK